MTGPWTTTEQVERAEALLRRWEARRAQEPSPRNETLVRQARERLDRLRSGS